MANEAIYELTQEPSLNAADRFVVQQSNATTRATSATFALMGGLEINAIGTVGNTTATVGTIDVWTMAGEAANRTWTLPGTAQVGERCGIYIVDGDATDEILIHTDATGDKIGNSTGFHSAGTEFTRLFIENECMIFRCVSAANPDWIVEYDGRVSCYGEASGTGTHTTNAGFEIIEMTTLVEQRGDWYDSVNDRFLLRRDAFIGAQANMKWTALDTTSTTWVLVIAVNGSNVSGFGSIQRTASSTQDQLAISGGKLLSAGDYIEMNAYQSESASEAYGTSTLGCWEVFF